MSIVANITVASLQICQFIQIFIVLFFTESRKMQVTSNDKRKTFYNIDTNRFLMRPETIVTKQIVQSNVYSS
jgi:hypothetical protein